MTCGDRNPRAPQVPKAEAPKAQAPKAQASAAKVFETVEGLSEQARLASSATPNPVSELAGTIRTMIASEVDPYILMGVLLEGMVQTLTARIPAARQPDMVLATVLMFQNRIGSAESRSNPLGCDSRPGATK